jgi:hypothetical protein
MQWAAAIAGAGLLVACSDRTPQVHADSIYTGGTIITINDAQPSVEALAVKDGKILAVGTRVDIEKNHKGTTTTVVDLGGKTLLPGFIDAHSHYFSSLNLANQANVAAPPVGPANNIPEILAELEKFSEKHDVPKGELIFAYGYDENAMPSGTAMGRDDLDAAFPDHPVLVQHISMHGAVLNSLALKKYGISKDTPTPPGGIIVRKKGTNEPQGLVMEMAWMPIFSSLPKPTLEQEVEFARAGQMMYAEAGITTAQEGATHDGEFDAMQRAAAKGGYLIDVIAFPFVTDFDKVLAKNPVEAWGKYHNRLKLGGAKITLDGSPFAKTAWFSTPYLTGGPGGEKNWTGEPGCQEPFVKEFVKKLYDLGVPLNAHMNGDATIDMFLRAHEYAAAGDPTKDRNVTTIHTQFITPAQLKKLAEYKIQPSFFTEHTFFWSAAHYANRGKAQTEFLSPMRAAYDLGMRPTNHTDGPAILPLNTMFVIWTAVTRHDRDGNVIGPDQRVTPLEALKAVTINAAYQYDEESSKGTLEPGKLADMVILDKNPLTVDPLTIKDIKVVETIKEGKTIYKAK